MVREYLTRKKVVALDLFHSCRDIRCSMGGNGIIALVRVVVSLVIIVFLLVGILANAAQSVPSTEKVKSLRFSGKDVNLFHVSKRKVPNGADPIHNRYSYLSLVSEIKHFEDVVLKLERNFKTATTNKIVDNSTFSIAFSRQEARFDFDCIEKQTLK
ncbi:hypothetical protein HID58_092423 [Brassica napus]|uniref:Uncharacterized protein n=1 Tax=Brassica napus TaxID=3708 RepID=A0ABQ7WYR6_BRANA|nr:hypothetical protein HID58_092423 [Brassica napus]